jgi:hypothetical protein
MENHTKLYINIKSGEVSIEGSEDFVAKQMANLADIVSLIQIEPSADDNAQGDTDISEEDVAAEVEAAIVQSSSANGELAVPDVFGQWLQMFKDDINDQDKALITAYYVQQDSEGNDFKTSQINKSLKDHGIKLANTSQTLKQIERKKLIFQTRKVGKLAFKRVSADGVRHLKALKR